MGGGHHWTTTTHLFSFPGNGVAHTPTRHIDKFREETPSQKIQKFVAVTNDATNTKHHEVITDEKRSHGTFPRESGNGY